MDIVNLWKNTNDEKRNHINIVKSWLCNSTDGQTYSVTDHILDFNVDEIIANGWNYEFPEDAFDNILGFKHDFKIDDENLEEIATKIVEELYDLNEDVELNPEKFFKRIENNPKWKCNAHKGISCDYCYGEENDCGYVEDCPFKKII